MAKDQLKCSPTTTQIYLFTWQLMPQPMGSVLSYPTCYPMEVKDRYHSHLILSPQLKKFHQYLCGRKFTLITDHKSLTAIFGPKKGIPTLAVARLQRWGLLFSAYDYEIQYKPTQSHGNADGFSRLPLPVLGPDGGGEAVSLFNVSQVQSLPITFQRVQQATKRDPILSKILRYMTEGWPKQIPVELKAYHCCRHEISIEHGCLLWRIRVIILTSLRQQLLKSLHEGHPGVVRMKSVARSYLCGVDWIRMLKNKPKPVYPAKSRNQILQLHLCTPGNGQQFHGREPTLTLQASFQENCS